MSAKTCDDLIEAIINEAAEDFVGRQRRVSENLNRRTQSPIERVLGMALHKCLTGCDDNDLRYDVDYRFGDLRDPGAGTVEIFAQAHVGRYIADFLVDFFYRGDRFFIVVECDGHDFHERTKEQARHDRRRDREMALMGIQVMRFTGSEIWEDPMRCAEDVHEMMCKMVGAL